MKSQNQNYFMQTRSRCLSALVFLSAFLFVAGQTPAQTPPKPCFDFFGTGRTSFATAEGIFAPTPNTNYIWRLRSNGGAGEENIFWGSYNFTALDTPAAGYYDGDNRADIAVYRLGATNSGYFIRPSTAPNTILGVQFGTLSVPHLTTIFRGREADYDGDGRDDLTTIIRTRDSTVYTWYYLRSRDNTLVTLRFGGYSNPAPQSYDRSSSAPEQFNDHPLPGADYNGDGRADLTVVRHSPNAGEVYFIGDSQTGQVILAQQWGDGETDRYIVGDYLGDSRADFAVARSVASNPTLTWYIKENGGSGIIAQNFGLRRNNLEAVDYELCGDYNGDGKSDIAVYRRSNNTFYWLNSPNNGSVGAQQFGQPDDIPLAWLKTHQYFGQF